MFIYFGIERGGQREKERESQKGSALSGRDPTQGWIPWSMRWPEPKSRARGLTSWATQEPLHLDNRGLEEKLCSFHLLLSPLVRQAWKKKHAPVKFPCKHLVRNLLTKILMVVPIGRVLPYGMLRAGCMGCVENSSGNQTETLDLWGLVPCNLSHQLCTYQHRRWP